MFNKKINNQKSYNHHIKIIYSSLRSKPKIKIFTEIVYRKSFIYCKIKFKKIFNVYSLFSKKSKENKFSSRYLLKGKIRPITKQYLQTWNILIF